VEKVFMGENRMIDRRTFLKGLVVVAFAESSGAADGPPSGARKVGFAPQRSINGFYFGWIPDLPTLKTQIFVSPFSALEGVPPRIDLRPTMPDVYDQGKIGSCTSNAIAACIQFARKKNGQGPDFVPSRLFIYFNGRAIENTVGSDSGLSIHDAITVVETSGVCPEPDWPYDAVEANDKGEFPKKNNRAVLKPPQKIYENDAFPHRTMVAFAIPQRIEQLQACLAAGFPFAFGFTIYSSFFDANKRPKTYIPVPKPQELPQSGHAVVAVGYDNSRQLIICRNSWNTKDSHGEIQEKGHFYMPYAYITDPDLAADFWTVRSVNALV
jgi:C1A family cysteine protease